MGPTLLIVISIVIATIIVLLSEKYMHRSVTDFPPPPPSKHRSSFDEYSRQYSKNRKRDHSFGKDWLEEDLFDEPLRNKKSLNNNQNSSRIVATIIFISILIGLLFFTTT